MITSRHVRIIIYLPFLNIRFYPIVYNGMDAFIQEINDPHTKAEVMVLVVT
jgi:hypothetical protein